MAIKLSDFRKCTYKAGGKVIEVPNLYESIKTDPKKGRKYLARFRLNEDIKTKVLGYSKKNGTVVLSPKQAGKLLEQYKSDLEAGYTSSSNVSLDKLFDFYFETLDTSKQWTHKKKYIYQLYVKPYLGKKKIEKIREMDIQNILNKMNTKGLSPRTRKSVMEVLNPLFKFAVTNKYLRDNPTMGITVKVPSQKKIVTNAGVCRDKRLLP
ncbi:MAG: hypothetical protein DSZ12_04735 [Sulfurovum sp.]|nr:MAG: hypothetical protein DSZ12_04735 [Sulfurovum sp.]